MQKSKGNILMPSLIYSMSLPLFVKGHKGCLAMAVDCKDYSN